MIKGLYALPPDVGAYLARIGLAPEDFRRAMHPELPPSPTGKSRWKSRTFLTRLSPAAEAATALS